MNHAQVKPIIDNASRQDLAQILAIYNEVIRNSTAVYSEEEFTPARGETWLDTKLGHGFPLIVARDASGITGFGTFGEFRAWPCYRNSVEHSVHVRLDRRGQGVGRALVVELMARAAAMGKHVMIAGTQGLDGFFDFRLCSSYHVPMISRLRYQQSSLELLRG